MSLFICLKNVPARRVLTEYGANNSRYQRLNVQQLALEANALQFVF